MYNKESALRSESHGAGHNRVTLDVHIQLMLPLYYWKALTNKKTFTLKCWFLSDIFHTLKLRVREREREIAKTSLILQVLQFIKMHKSDINNWYS